MYYPYLKQTKSGVFQMKKKINGKRNTMITSHPGSKLMLTITDTTLSNG